MPKSRVKKALAKWARWLLRSGKSKDSLWDLRRAADGFDGLVTWESIPRQPLGPGEYRVREISAWH